MAAAPHTQPRPDSIWLNKACPDQHPVVVDPHVGRRLRPHQVEGVQFLYDSVMGAKDPSLRGALLADEARSFVLEEDACSCTRLA